MTLHFKKWTLFSLAISISLMLTVGNGMAEMTGKGSDATYIAQVTKAAPASVVQGATIVQIQKDGSMRTVRPGSNGFTCMMLDPKTPMCADKNAMAWMHALMTKTAPPDQSGFMYMLGGDDGASNTDPYATAATATNHWVTTGPHVMIVGPSVKTMGYPATADADPSRPYVMWADTPYAHLMIPVGGKP
ncbi:MAG: hypothetical protein JO322_08805 [Candidatus Eremiobacteraeota bacterium]|nr:hypothetical protein [Candidatus Eremiobacteraeota bacterium]